MTRAELCQVISASGLSAPMRAAAMVAVNMMPAAEFGRLSEVADRGLTLLRAGDKPGFLAYAREVAAANGAPVELVEAILSNVERATVQS